MSNKTYSELTANLQGFLEDDDVEFSGSIDEVINLGEMRLWRDLDLSLFTSRDTADTVASQPTVTKPTTDPELVTFQTLYYDDVGGRVFLELRSHDWVLDHQTVGATEAPRYYAERDETTWLLSPIPDGIYTLNCRGITRPTRLSAGNTTTWLSLHQDDLLLLACLAEAERFLKGDDRVEVWKQEYVDRLPMAKRETYELMNQHYHLTPLQVPGQATTQR